MVILCTAFLFVCLVSGFVPQNTNKALARRWRSIADVSAKRGGETEQDFESLMPETSFGAESVPEGQRPVNEYLEVLRQPLFDWAALDSGNSGLLTRLVLVYGVVFVTVCYPISGATYTEDGFLIQKLAASNVGALFVIFFLLIRLYSGWGYVASRLTSKVIEYEETGWYDGDFEMKSETELKRDQFLYNSKVRPVVDRVKAFTLGCGGLWLASVVGFNLAVNAKPVLNQYDPKLLERLQLDDRLAERSASYSQNRPTYCDNRYYRAVAGGGQGCN